MDRKTRVVGAGVAGQCMVSPAGLSGKTRPFGGTPFFVPRRSIDCTMPRLIVHLDLDAPPPRGSSRLTGPSPGPADRRRPGLTGFGAQIDLQGEHPQVGRLGHDSPLHPLGADACGRVCQDPRPRLADPPRTFRHTGGRVTRKPLQKTPETALISTRCLVGARGFEPPTT
jgi:hypothetical protein